MESKTNLSEIQTKFLSTLADHYPEHERRQIFLLTAEHVLNYSKIDTILKSNEPISADDSEKFLQILKRLKEWEPIQYIFGYCSFYGLTFKVDKRVLIPRQETEELVHWIIGGEGNQPYELLDIATGSGCIAVALAANLHHVSVSACDISLDAISLAKNNAQLNKANVSIFGLDLLQETISLPSKYRVIVSNPPYVRECEKALMKPNVLEYEPAIALFVPDKDPLLYYKRIALLARKYLLDGGTLYLEINEHFSDEIVKLLQCAGFYSVEVKEDLNGKKRMVRGRK
jgi:release factor glutamine methyltransferase